MLRIWLSRLDATRLGCGVEIVTYCVMGNHFHILLRVPNRARFMEQFDGPKGEARLLAHLKVLSCKEHLR